MRGTDSASDSSDRRIYRKEDNMVVDRRTFIQSAAFLSTGGLLFYSADVLASGSPPLGSTGPRTAVEADGKSVFRVDGWDRRDHRSAEYLKMFESNPTRPDFAGDEVFIRVNRTWRTAWR
jgi:hypothetical protein